ncbi:class I SAM-dependent methyltransferase [Microbispora corallina]|uniref:Methyltransferase type 12 n=1 Tax=Microbispora corallina TaxID=83302 RepID=A0ABQ4G172_9ACTN|nr:methyltransferase domain-containing protein [Microbispora corallina]GIH40824.1 methyltransferase type 12 [Microbispora corallina]
MGELYAESLTGAATEIEYADGTRRPLESARWLEPIDGDEAVLARCAAPTLDVGSGPGRLTAALARRGVPALGIDITPHAVRLTRRAGGFALVRDVFDQVPRSGRWATVLLADGNIGIGGHPLALLRRAGELARPGGEVLAELEPPGTASRVDRVRLRRGPARGEWFGWARVSVADIARLGAAAGFSSVEPWGQAERWFATLRTYA